MASNKTLPLDEKVFQEHTPPLDHSDLEAQKFGRGKAEPARLLEKDQRACFPLTTYIAASALYFCILEALIVFQIGIETMLKEKPQVTINSMITLPPALLLCAGAFIGGVAFFFATHGVLSWFLGFGLDVLFRNLGVYLRSLGRHTRRG